MLALQRAIFIFLISPYSNKTYLLVLLTLLPVKVCKKNLGQPEIYPKLFANYITKS